MGLYHRGSIWYSFQPFTGGSSDRGCRAVVVGVVMVVRGLVWQFRTDRHNLDQRWNLRALQSDRKHWLNSHPI